MQSTSLLSKQPMFIVLKLDSSGFVFFVFYTSQLLEVMKVIVDILFFYFFLASSNIFHWSQSTPCCYKSCVSFFVNPGNIKDLLRVLPKTYQPEKKG